MRRRSEIELTHSKQENPRAQAFWLVSREHDECAGSQSLCDENAICTNTIRGHLCTCKPGYVGNGTICRGSRAHCDYNNIAVIGTERRDGRKEKKIQTLNYIYGYFSVYMERIGSLL
ncbi:hypothetical protein F2P81_004151 [Scophthalmus maximus]|uniref:EGF-like domain-containing protein n=1 Tax=Scophthalmus maximus TaxID=52904 RepID=A0A6A4THV7_SCOMX|nr:hypothetical protein F2P81_004151 [Scophthalmus maximus]